MLYEFYLTYFHVSNNSLKESAQRTAILLHNSLHFQDQLNGQSDGQPGRLSNKQLG